MKKDKSDSCVAVGGPVKIIRQGIGLYNQNNRKNMVSVVIPTHNRVDLLPRAIESVFNQSFKDVEVIVVSDGSADGTDDYMKKYENDSRVQYINYKPARGGNYARNKGIRASKGEYIAFLDDDDEWLPTKIELQVALMKADERLGLVYTGTHVIYVDEGIEYNSHPEKKGDLSKDILFSNYIGSTTTVLVKSSLLKELGGFDENLQALQDYDLWIRICQKANVGVVSLALVNYYNYRNTRQVSSNTDKYVRSYAYLNDKYAPLLSILTDKEKNKRLANIKNGLGKRELRNGSKIRAIKCYLTSLRYEIRKKTFLYIVLALFDYRFILKLRKKYGNK